ncbi:MAG: hypothetical protein K1060chlam3_00780 [Candidatus Anoxychlamydiales bacterium]|nr:hypothetical protein [Candidatus Anoxychlamydiales bacterium]
MTSRISLHERETLFKLLAQKTPIVKIAEFLNRHCSAKDLEKVASSGISFLLSPPQSLLKFISEFNRSNKIRVVGIL